MSTLNYTVDNTRLVFEPSDHECFTLTIRDDDDGSNDRQLRLDQDAARFIAAQLVVYADSVKAVTLSDKVSQVLDNQGINGDIKAAVVQVVAEYEAEMQALVVIPDPVPVEDPTPPAEEAPQQ